MPFTVSAMRLQAIENINFIYVVRIVEMNLKLGVSRSVGSCSPLLRYHVDVQTCRSITWCEVFMHSERGISFSVSVLAL